MTRISPKWIVRIMALVAVILGNVLMHHGWSFWRSFALLMSAAFAIGLLSSFLWRKRVYIDVNSMSRGIPGINRLPNPR